MKKRVFPLLVLLTLILTVPAQAHEEPGPFVRSRVYSGQFADLTDDSPFYDNVSALYEYGLSVGKADGTFGLTDCVTVNQVVIFAARIRSLYDFGDAETGAAAFYQEGQAAYRPYALYLQSLGVIGRELEPLYGTVAVRSTVAHILAGTLPEEALPRIHTELIRRGRESGVYLPDVGPDTPFAEDILTLYECGLSQGSDSVGTFRPDAPITRGALAAMLTRMVDKSLRLTPHWLLLHTAAGITWGDLVPAEIPPVTAPHTPEEMEQAVLAMLAQESGTLKLQYHAPVSPARAQEIMDQSLIAVRRSAEQGYNTVVCMSDALFGNITLVFTMQNCSPEQTAAYRDETLQNAIAVHDRLWAQGMLTEDMTDYQKAAVYFDWICGACTYDTGASDTSLSHMAYSVFHDGTAVCDGYTSAYNLLLKLEGISCYAMFNTDHAWTVATLDGVEYHIDTTWGDWSDSAPDRSYFAMTEAASRRAHPW